MSKATLYTDGGARGNPGPAGIGYVLKLADGTCFEEGATMGIATNNQAEYEALERGLTVAKQQSVESLAVYMDSELIIKQMQGKYRVKHPDLQLRHRAVSALVTHFTKVTFHHVPRAKNKRADQLVNEALDSAVST